TAADGAEPEDGRAPAARRLDRRRDARVADRVLRVAGERRLVHGGAADHLAALLRGAADLGDRGEDEGLVDAEGVHRRVDLGAELPAEPGVDLLENEPGPARSDVGERRTDAPARFAGRQGAALRVADAERPGADVGGARVECGLDGDAARPREQLAPDVARPGQVVGEDTYGVHGAGLFPFGSGEEDGARGCAVEIGKLERQADEGVAPRLDGAEVEPLDDEHPGAEERPVDGEVRASEPLDREVVHADRAHAARDEERRRVLREVGEVAPELRRLPPPRVVRPAEEDVARPERHAPERGGIDRRPAPEVGDDGLADHAVERHVPEAGPVGQEMIRGIDVRPRVAPHGEQREVAHVPAVDPALGGDRGHRVARIDVHAGPVRDGHVDDARPARDVDAVSAHHTAPPWRAASPGSAAPIRAAATSAATRSASSRFLWSATFLPAMSKAVPCPVEVRTSGSPTRSVTTVPKPSSFTAMSPWSW